MQPGYVIPQRIDLLVGQPARDARHVAGVIGAVLRAEILELLDDKRSRDFTIGI